jgi:hypothetical protein
MPVRKMTNGFLKLWLGLLLLLVACTSSEELVVAEFETLSLPNSTLLYESSYVASGATGDCTSSVIDRWYGSSTSLESIAEIFGDQLLNEGWMIETEDVVQIWRKKDSNGLFTLAAKLFASNETINPNRAYYYLPDSIVNELVNYKEVYVITLSYMPGSDVERCFS